MVWLLSCSALFNPPWLAVFDAFDSDNWIVMECNTWWKNAILVCFITHQVCFVVERIKIIDHLSKWTWNIHESHWTLHSLIVGLVEFFPDKTWLVFQRTHKNLWKIHGSMADSRTESIDSNSFVWRYNFCSPVGHHWRINTKQTLPLLLGALS